jgi:NADH:ubiquinone oxidoreductase subunit 4 (subunit M)
MSHDVISTMFTSRVGRRPLKLDTIRRILGYQLTIAQLIALGLTVGTPYLLIGAAWSTTHTAHLQNMHGVDLAVSFLGSIVSWPVLLFSNVCMT